VVTREKNNPTRVLEKLMSLKEVVPSPHFLVWGIGRINQTGSFRSQGIFLGFFSVREIASTIELRAERRE
jgi:hypothetical protein